MLRTYILLSLAVFLGWLISSIIPLQTSKDPWDIANTLGTIAAVIVALHFAIRGQLSARGEARELARLTASRAKATICRQKEIIEMVYEILVEQDKLTDPSKDNLARAMARIKEAAPYLDFETLLNLVPLPKRSAHRLARVQGQCETLCAEMALRLSNWDSSSDADRKNWVRVWLLSMIGARHDVDIAYKVCTNAFCDSPPTRSLNWD